MFQQYWIVNMSDSDNDYIDVGEEDDTSEEIIDEVPTRVGPGRWKDIAWVQWQGRVWKLCLLPGY